MLEQTKVDEILKEIELVIKEIEQKKEKLIKKDIQNKN